MAKAEFVYLAQDYDPTRHGVGGWMLSEKEDGFRCIWDGGVSRGLPKPDVPWANNAKDGRYVTPPLATGLWTRYGNVYHAPDWFLDMLPPFPLDGELTMGRGTWQETSKAIKPIVPGPAWRQVRYRIIDSPRWEMLFQDRNVTDPNFTKKIRGALTFAKSRQTPFVHPTGTMDFDRMHDWLVRQIEQSDNLEVMPQVKLPMHTSGADAIIKAELERVLDLGGEGLILRNFVSMWRPERSWDLLKWKPEKDAEGTVTGYTWGKETDKGSKLLGLMGALVLDYKGQRLKLSGFKEEERVMEGKPLANKETEPELRRMVARVEGESHPGEEVETHYFHNPRFPIGSVITFRYRELSDGGIPKEARYHRKFHA